MGRDVISPPHLRPTFTMHTPPQHIPFSDHAKFILGVLLALAVLTLFAVAVHF